MISGFNEWAASAQLGHTDSFAELNERRLGIEAEDFIANILTTSPTKEPLLPALGGLPFALEETITNHVGVLRSYGCQPYFIFNGVTSNGQEERLQAATRATKSIANAWELYGASEPERAVAEFDTLSGTINVDNIYRFVQNILRKHDVDFLVAPHSACAQLASIAGTEFCDAVAGSSDILMYEIDQLITKLDFEQAQFSWVTRRECMEALGAPSTAMFVDACLLSGCSILPTLPQLENDMTASPRTPKIRAAADLLKRSQANGNALCLQYQDDPAMIALNYLDRYRKASLYIKHYVCIRPNGKIESVDGASAPSDLNNIMGHRLPEEAFGYLSHGIISPEVLSWIASNEIIERPPLDGGEADAYRRLVSDSLTPLRTSALSLLTYSFHRFYQHRPIYLRCWFSPNAPKTLNVADTTDPRTTISGWNVRLEQITAKATKLERDVSSLAFAVSSLQDAEFAKTTVTPKSNGQKPLGSSEEVQSNALWRFLQLRGYIQQDHQLSTLGQCLQTAFSRHNQQDLEEPTLLAFEMLRLNLLNSNNMFPYNGSPQRGSETDKRNTLLVSRVACFAGLRHKSIGFTGPLSRHLLAYTSMVSAVRGSLRNVVEMSLFGLLANHHVDRNIAPSVLAQISYSLPFLNDVDCALGIAVKSYLDELSAQSEPTSEASRQAVKTKGANEWFPHATDFQGDLQRAFALWDSVYAAVASAPETLVAAKDKKVWEEADAWLSERK
ncbi:PIN domain-like protein, partial [Aureobasidium melanogenum]